MQGAQRRQCRCPGTFEQSPHFLTGNHTLDALHLLQPSAQPAHAVRCAWLMTQAQLVTVAENAHALAVTSTLNY